MSEKAPIVPNKRLQQTQAQVNEVVDIMRVNVDKVLERDKNLSELDGRADALQAGASQFEASAGKLKRKFWWKNCKMLMVLGALITILIIVIIVWIVSDQKQQHSDESDHRSLNGTHLIVGHEQPGGLRGKEAVPNWPEPRFTDQNTDHGKSELGKHKSGESTPSVRTNTQIQSQPTTQQQSEQHSDSVPSGTETEHRPAPNGLNGAVKKFV